MKIHYQSHLRSHARELRRSMTDAERRLWQAIRQRQIHGVQFFRQRPIGHYIVDFYCPTKKIVIEVDGGQHYEEQGQKSDGKRDVYLTKLGLRVIRFNNREVLANIEGVLEHIAGLIV